LEFQHRVVKAYLSFTKIRSALNSLTFDTQALKVFIKDENLARVLFFYPHGRSREETSQVGIKSRPKDKKSLGVFTVAREHKMR